MAKYTISCLCTQWNGVGDCLILHVQERSCDQNSQLVQNCFEAWIRCWITVKKGRLIGSTPCDFVPILMWGSTLINFNLHICECCTVELEELAATWVLACDFAVILGRWNGLRGCSWAVVLVLLSSFAFMFCPVWQQAFSISRAPMVPKSNKGSIQTHEENVFWPERDKKEGENEEEDSTREGCKQNSRCATFSWEHGHQCSFKDSCDTDPGTYCCWKLSSECSSQDIRCSVQRFSKDGTKWLRKIVIAITIPFRARELWRSSNSQWASECCWEAERS